MFCVKCGKKLEADAAFCTECGAKVEAPSGTAACSETGAPEIKAEKPAAYPALTSADRPAAVCGRLLGAVLSFGLPEKEPRVATHFIR